MESLDNESKSIKQKLAENDHNNYTYKIIDKNLVFKYIINSFTRIY